MKIRIGRNLEYFTEMQLEICENTLITKLISNFHKKKEKPTGKLDYVDRDRIISNYGNVMNLWGWMVRLIKHECQYACFNID